MNQLSPDLREDLLEVLDEVSTLMSAEYAQLGPLPDDHPLAQSGLENGAEIVLDFIAHGIQRALSINFYCAFPEYFICGKVCLHYIDVIHTL